MRISTRPNKDHDFRGTLAALFTDIFAPDELRRFIHSLPNGNHLSCALPGSEASMFSLSDAAERLLVRHGLVDAHLFHQLAILRPVRADAIFALGHLACPSTPADAQANAAAPPPTEHRLRATEVFPLHDLLLGAVSPTTSPLELTWRPSSWKLESPTPIHLRNRAHHVVTLTSASPPNTLHTWRGLVFVLTAHDTSLEVDIDPLGASHNRHVIAVAPPQGRSSP